MFPEIYMPGATVIGLTFKEGVILGGEKRFSYGRFVVSRQGKKVFKITDRVGAACAGMVADMQVLVRQISAYARIKEMELRKPLAPNSVAKLISVLMFELRYRPLLTQVVVGGVDTQPAIFALDPLGSLIPDDYVAIGSGAEIAIGVLESGYKPDLNEESAKQLAMMSIKSAIQRDAASGDGVDFLIIDRNQMKEESTALR